MTRSNRTAPDIPVPHVLRVVRVLGRAAVGGAIWLALAWPVGAASPTPSAGAGGDPRSSGEGPGLVGEPVVALVAVLAIGLAAVALTVVYLRVTARRHV